MKHVLYTGASGCIARDKIATLGRNYVVQPKPDGCYSTITFDATGLLSQIILRNGSTVRPDIMRDYAGIRWAPNSALVCELEIWTDAANRLAASRGYRIATIFDALRVDGLDVTRDPYSVRRDALFRAESLLVQDSDDRPWTPDASGRAHDQTTGHYTRPVPQSWRRLPIIEQRPVRAVDALWTDYVERNGGEGVVVVALNAPLGRRGSKRKCRDSRTMEAKVERYDNAGAVLTWAGGSFVVACTGRLNAELAVGAIVEVKYDGFLERTGQPKHPRITRLRTDLMPAVLH